MDKRKITAREVVKDIRAGADDQTLMKKYQLSAQGLQSVFGKLLKAGVVSQDELEDRVPMSERTVDLGLYICPACGNIQDKAFDECSRCGFVPPSARKAKEEVKDKKVVAGRKGPQTGFGRKILSATQTEAAGFEKEIQPTALIGLSKLVLYCRILGIAAIVSYGLIIAGVLAVMYRWVPPAALSATQVLLSLLAVGIPALVLSLVIFIALRALAESIKLFSDVSKQFLETRSEDRC